MNQTETAVAVNQIDKHDPVVVAYRQATQCYYRPETEELVFIADLQAGAFEGHWRELAIYMDAYHQANTQYSNVLEDYGRAASSATGLSSLAEQTHAAAIRAAEKEVELHRAELQKKLGDFSQQGMRYDDVVELIPLGSVGGNKKHKGKPTRYAYVKKGYFSESEKGRKLHRVKLKSADKNGVSRSIYRKDKKGRTHLDVQMLGEQLTALQWPTLKLELQDVLKWTGSEADLSALNQDVTLFDWAHSWNESLEGKVEYNQNIDVSAGAQFMRFASNVGASAEFDPLKGQASLKGEASASLSLASATVNLTAYVPDRFGWSLSLTRETGPAFDLGKLRLYLTPELKGFIGASVMVEGQMQVMTQGDQQILAGQPGGRLPRFQARKTRGAVFHKQMAEEDEGLKLSAEAFAGARIESTLKGGLQWLKPTPPPGLDAPLTGVLGSVGKFTDFCSITSNISGLLGAGIGGKFHCTFINGKFCFHVAASVCWGVGAKGGLIGEVGVGSIVEFGAWLVYQLYRLDYGFLDVMDSDAFKTYSQYCILKMSDIHGDVYGVFESMSASVDSVFLDFNKYMKLVLNKGRDAIEASSRRNQMAANVISRHDDLLSFTPESKGILLYVLTRHGKWDHLDLNNRGKFMLDIYQDRKEAVTWVLKSIQTRAEWRKVLCRMTKDGSSLAIERDKSVVVAQQEQQLVDFLQEGFNRDADLHKAKEELAVVYGRLKTDAAWGYSLAMNDSIYYQLNSLDNPHYPKRCDFGPCGADYDRLA